MKRLTRALIVVALFAFFVQPVAAAGSGATNLFIGLWKAIDNLDGSEILLSISDVDGDGELRILITETFFSFCVSEGFASSPGLLEGTGTVQKKTLSWEFKFKCYDPLNNILDEVDVEGGNNGSFTLIPKDGILVDNNFGDIYHRVGNH